MSISRFDIITLNDHLLIFTDEDVYNLVVAQVVRGDLIVLCKRTMPSFQKHILWPKRQHRFGDRNEIIHVTNLKLRLSRVIEEREGFRDVRCEDRGYR